MNLASSSEARITLRDKFRAATREAILEAAAGLLTAEGGAHVRMEDIAATAGIAVGTLYNYFRDRTALVSALLESRTRGLFEGLDQSCSPSPAGDRTPATAFASELEHFVGAVCRHFDANRFLLSVLVEEERQRGVDATVVSRRRTILEELLTRAERLMAKGIRSRALRKGDPATYAALLVGMVRGVTSSALMRGDANVSGATAEVVRLFMTGAAR